MSFIDTPAASSSSTPANSRPQGKRPAVPRYAQTLSTFEALDLFADDETAQKICSYFKDPDTILAIDELAKVSRAHQQEEQEIRLARLRSCAQQTMATVLLDQLQSWGLEREIHDVLRKHCHESPTTFRLPPPLPRDLLSLCLHLDDLQKQRSVNEVRPMLRRLQQITQRAQRRSPATIVVNPDTFAPNAPSSNAFTATDTHPDTPSKTVATTQRTSNTLTPIMEELTRIFSTTPESQTPQANHMETNELVEMMDFTPSET
ncbi:hypothetical protein CVT25_009664 [Psilocybe cyanescens]|uniref:Uncharacterized protein n=1 Tax=Psilocybe cyanescens TaxID=93625 RepID=A0A409XDC4_PSICY|nr:hypothetical protein CVT25_009664 [Psilocybe cyanescens]